MQMVALGSSRDAFLVMVPLVLVLFVSFLRMDEKAGKGRKIPRRLRPSRGVDARGHAIFLDPDGRPGGSAESATSES
jgi:hypothetical protein